MLAAFVTLPLFACSSTPSDPAETDGQVIGQAWADNWFALYQGDALVVEDSVSITTERSFNAETFSFEPTWPLQLAFVLKDFKQDDSGLEYIGQRNQQMGDGGFIAQFVLNGVLLAATDASMRCLVIHEAPLDRSCVDDPTPIETCGFRSVEEPVGWRAADFDDSGWSSATEYSEAQVDPKDGYDALTWNDAARLVWSSDLETHNTVLCRLRVDAP